MSTVVSESEVVEEPAVSLTESESQVSTSEEVTSAISETVSTSEEVILDGLSENINSWNRLSVAPRVSETLPSTSETITEERHSLATMQDIQKQQAQNPTLW